MNRASSKVSEMPSFFASAGVDTADGVQQHHTVGRQDPVGLREELRVPVVSEVLEGADGDDPVHGFVELLPALQQHPPGPLGVHFIEAALDVRGLVLRQRQSDDVDVVFLHRAPRRGAPPAADVQQRHTGLESQLAQRQVDLGQLGFFQGHVVALEISTAIRLGRVLEKTEEVVGQVVVCLYIFEVRFELFGHWPMAFRLSAFVGYPPITSLNQISIPPGRSPPPAAFVAGSGADGSDFAEPGSVSCRPGRRPPIG